MEPESNNPNLHIRASVMAGIIVLVTSIILGVGFILYSNFTEHPLTVDESENSPVTTEIAQDSVVPSNTKPMEKFPPQLSIIVDKSNRQLVQSDNRVTIESITMPSPGFVEIDYYVSGISDLLPAGTSKNVEILLDKQPNHTYLPIQVYLDDNNDGIPQLDNVNDHYVPFADSEGKAIELSLPVAVRLPGNLSILNNLLLKDEQVGECTISGRMEAARIESFFTENEEIKERLNIDTEAFVIDWDAHGGGSPFFVSPSKGLYVSYNNGTITINVTCSNDSTAEGIKRFEAIVAELEK